MQIKPGTVIGAFTVVGPIGAGGMGEVYKARDAKLDRDVAIKVLPASFAQDADRVARFTREAKTLASLNHPNIAAIYGLEGTALVMELVEGDDLSQRIARGAIPLEEALPIAKQTRGSARSGARAGHHPSRPEARQHQGSRRRRSEGARLRSRQGVRRERVGRVGATLMNSPTLTAHATQMGMILGTAAYMAPEQAKGSAVDKRADIWAFGVVLYEMLSGRRGYEAEDVSDTLAAVLTRDVDWTKLPAATPPRSPPCCATASSGTRNSACATWAKPAACSIN